MSIDLNQEPSKYNFIDSVMRQLTECGFKTKYCMNKMMNIVIKIVEYPKKMENGNYQTTVTVDCWGEIKNKTFERKNAQEISIYKVAYVFWE